MGGHAEQARPHPILCPGQELLEVIRPELQARKAGWGSALRRMLPGEGGSELARPLVALGRAGMKTPKPRLPGEPAQASGLSSVAAAARPLKMLHGRRQGLGVLGATDRCLRSHFGVRRERLEPRLQFH